MPPCRTPAGPAWGVFDAGVMGWRATDLLENEGSAASGGPQCPPSISTGSGTRVVTNRFDPPIEVNQQPGQLEARSTGGSKTARVVGLRTRSKELPGLDAELQTSAQLKRADCCSHRTRPETRRRARSDRSPDGTLICPSPWWGLSPD